MRKILGIIAYLLLPIISWSQSDLTIIKDSLNFIIESNKYSQTNDTNKRLYFEFVKNKKSNLKFSKYDPLNLGNQLNSSKYPNCNYYKYFDDPVNPNNFNRVYKMSILGTTLTDIILHPSNEKYNKMEKEILK